MCGVWVGFDRDQVKAGYGVRRQAALKRLWLVGMQPKGNDSLSGS